MITREHGLRTKFGPNQVKIDTKCFDGQDAIAKRCIYEAPGDPGDATDSGEGGDAESPRDDSVG
jgi:hypothetical protein